MTANVSEARRRGGRTVLGTRPPKTLVSKVFLVYTVFTNDLTLYIYIFFFFFFFFFCVIYVRYNYLVFLLPTWLNLCLVIIIIWDPFRF